MIFVHPVAQDLVQSDLQLHHFLLQVLVGRQEVEYPPPEQDTHRRRLGHLDAKVEVVLVLELFDMIAQ